VIFGLTVNIVQLKGWSASWYIEMVWKSMAHILLNWQDHSGRK